MINWRYTKEAVATFDVGTGKTAVATATALHFGLQNLIDQVLVVMPPILLRQWERWLSQFGVSVQVYAGTPAQRNALDLESDFTLMTYNIFKNDFERLLNHFRRRRVFVILDEAAAIRRASTLNFKSVRDFLFTPDKFLMLLTGTAINNPMHCYGHIKLKTPSVYRSYGQFKSIHVAKEDYWGEPTSFQNLDLLTENFMLQAVYIRADDVLSLPEVVYDPVQYDLAPNHKRLYDTIVEEQLVVLKDGTILDGTIPQRLFHTTQRVILLPGEFGNDKIKPEAFSLIDAMADEANIFSGSGEKIVVFVNYTSSNRAAYEHTRAIKGLNPLQAYGEMGATVNLKNIDRFLNDPEINVLIAHPRSIGIGLNLQSVCRLILFLELPITSNDFTQAVGRIKREGQRRSCLVRIAVARGTIQETLQHRVVAKEDLVQQILPTKDTLRNALFGRR